MYILKPLPYDFAALEPYIDEKTVRIHHDGHQATYVKNLNEAVASYPDLEAQSPEDLLINLEDIPADIKTKIRNNAGGVVNHELYWEVMAPNHEDVLPLPTGKLAAAIDKVFDSFTAFQERFSKVATSHFGSGYAWLVNTAEGIMITETANQDSPLTLGHTPIIGLDVWEHAYYLKYQNKRTDYVKNWWYLVNWAQAEKNYQEALSKES
ncbi:superoxide dismutase [Patescibacteria group bacterium]|nr:superoxide dismutase [Patescibacteria group bacterium]